MIGSTLSRIISIIINYYLRDIFKFNVMYVFISKPTVCLVCVWLDNNITICYFTNGLLSVFNTAV